MNRFAAPAQRHTQRLAALVAIKGLSTAAGAVLLALLPAASALAASGPARYFHKPDAWFAGPEARRAAENILSHQSDLGGWPKNVDTTAEPFRGDRAKLKPTFDNGATTDELRFLARIAGTTREMRYRESFLRGLDHILKAQYPTGGWPQSYPPGKQYHRHITFNDNAMVRLMDFLRDVSREKTFAFVDRDRRNAAKGAFNRGIECILRCQIRVGGRRTAWCAQHDELDLRPRPARSYELASLSGSESVAIVRLLMSLAPPSPEVVAAVDGAIAWFEAAKLPGIRVVVKESKGFHDGRDRVVVEDRTAPPMWARFYEIGTNRPIFCDRDGVPKSHLADIGHERRNGYSWLGYWPQSLLEKDYPAWKRMRQEENRTPGSR